MPFKGSDCLNRERVDAIETRLQKERAQQDPTSSANAAKRQQILLIPDEYQDAITSLVMHEPHDINPYPTAVSMYIDRSTLIKLRANNKPHPTSNTPIPKPTHIDGEDVEAYPFDRELAERINVYLNIEELRFYLADCEQIRQQNIMRSLDKISDEEAAEIMCHLEMTQTAEYIAAQKISVDSIPGSFYGDGQFNTVMTLPVILDGKYTIDVFELLKTFPSNHSLTKEEAAKKLEELESEKQRRIAELREKYTQENNVAKNSYKKQEAEINTQINYTTLAPDSEEGLQRLDDLKNALEERKTMKSRIKDKINAITQETSANESLHLVEDLRCHLSSCKHEIKLLKKEIKIAPLPPDSPEKQKKREELNADLIARKDALERSIKERKKMESKQIAGIEKLTLNSFLEAEEYINPYTGLPIQTIAINFNLLQEIDAFIDPFERQLKVVLGQASQFDKRAKLRTGFNANKLMRDLRSSGKSFAKILEEEKYPEKLLPVGLSKGGIPGTNYTEIMTHPVCINGTLWIDLDRLLEYWKPTSRFFGLFGHASRHGLNPFDNDQPIKTITYDMHIKECTDRFMLNREAYKAETTEEKARNPNFLCGRFHQSFGLITSRATIRGATGLSVTGLVALAEERDAAEKNPVDSKKKV
jgi:hypothetical protein